VTERYTYPYYPESAKFLSIALFVILMSLLGIFFFSGLGLPATLFWCVVIVVISLGYYFGFMRNRSDIILDDNGVSRLLPGREWFALPWSCIASVQVGLNLQTKGAPITYYRINLHEINRPPHVPKRPKINADMVRRDDFKEDFERALRRHGIPLTPI
jgi:hypothetical protein